ncbi:MAG TPA: hypothetical protein VJS11_02770, partial [Acidobacteriaceae bacterium]|nr:hypothetical protein [Acidobacteriaceae bacterium]
MDPQVTDRPVAEKPPAPEKRLDSWKEIAAWMNRDVTTAQRWEKREGMPVHRHAHEKRGSVYALTSELDAWLKSRKPLQEENERPIDAEARPERRQTRPRWILWALTTSIAFAAVFGWIIARRQPGVTPQQQIRSLAVLPLKNLSGDPAQEYLADGITEALIGRLAGLRDLHVISHTSVMRYRNPQVSIPEIARDLHVDAVVEGSVIRDGDHIRVTAQLIRGATDEHFWSETYDREFRDVLTLESDLAQSIAEKVAVTVTGEEQKRIAQVRPVAPEVYESYLKGRFALRNSNTPSEIEQSIGYFNDALARDPTFAPAYVGIAQSYIFLGTVMSGVPPSETRPNVISYSRRALALDPGLPDAHAALGKALQEEWKWSDAESEYQRALALSPNNPDALAREALWQACQGRTDDAVAEIQRARALDPVGLSGAGVAWVLFLSHRFDESARELRSMLPVRPDSAAALWYLGFALTAGNQPGEAIAPLEKAVSLSHRSPAVLAILIRAYAHAGRRADALRLLAEMQQRARVGYVPAGAFVNA